MAEIHEDIIIIEDSEAAQIDDYSADNNLNDDDESSNKKKIIIFGAIAATLILIIITAIFLSLQTSNKEKVTSIGFIQKKLEKKPTQIIETTKLENMIAKADYLYSNGSKDEALFLYEKIAHYSEAISQYNLGVAQLKNEQYQLALDTFTKAIKNDEKRCVSAINAAVCSLHLNDKESFKYYIDLAHAYLSHEIDSPLYSYYYALISYYNNNYLEALSALKNPSSNNYPSIHKNLSTKINALYANDYDALDVMEKHFEDYDDFSIALLYARVGDFTLAINHLNEAILENVEPVKAQLALGLINLKAGRIASANKEIKNVTDMFPEEVYKHYPIKVHLKEALFDSKKAQKIYRKDIVSSKNLNYQKIFYFSPYKVFNANQTISYIRKGNANIYIDNIESAKEYLKKSASSSSVNIGITKAIKKALSFKIRTANEELQELVKIQPKHSILHYNLALTYAQMGNLVLANKHFIRSYHLDAKNYLSGVYAVLTGQITSRENHKLTSILKESLVDEESSEEINLYRTLLHISDNNFISAVDWLDNDYKQRPLYLALDIIIAIKLNMLESAKKSATKLTILLPNDILPHMMHIDANYSDLKTIAYATEVSNYLKNQKFTFNDLYYGPYITRYLYIQQNLITGKLYFLREQLREILETTQEYTHEIQSALALASLFDKQNEESYTLYNHLIDEMKVQDAHTLYLAAVASTAAKHHENAIALLELSKIKDGNFAESRYALALLYLEIKNNQGASIQLSRIKENSFISKYFDFEIDQEQLYLKKTTKKSNP